MRLCTRRCGLDSIVQLLICSISLQAAADTHYVSLSGGHRWPYTNWVDAATNIQPSVDAAGYGDVVLVADGVYHVTAQVVVDDAITLMSVNGHRSTVVDAGYTSRCIYMTTSNAVVDGLTLRHGDSSVNDINFGGGVRCDGGVLQNCVAETLNVTIAFHRQDG